MSEERFVITVDCVGQVGLPLSFAGWLMKAIAEDFPHSTVADPPPGVPLALSITYEDMDAVLNAEYDLDD